MSIDDEILDHLRLFRDQAGRGTTISEDQLAVQAALARRLCDRLAADPAAAVVLASRTGTGKTVVSLVAGMKALTDGAHIDRICILAPNRRVRTAWLRTVEPLTTGSELTHINADRVPEPGQISALSVEVLRRRGIGQLPAGTLVILDEAHRGTQSTKGVVYQHLAAVCRDRPVLLVSATPYQLSTDGLIAMLSVNASRQRTKELKDVRRLATVLRDLLVDTGAPPTSRQLEQLRRTAQRARATIDTHLVNVPPGSFPNTDYRPDHRSISEVPLTGVTAPVSGSWDAGYWAARATPAVLGHTLGDMFNRGLDSSSETFWASKVGAELLRDKRPEIVQFRSQLEKRLGAGRDHPKVRATVDWVTEKVRERRHVLVFAYFRATQTALQKALADAIDASEAEIAAPTGNSIPRRIEHRLRAAPTPTDPPVVLVVTDRFSESINLDGGRPCVVHHDLPWNPNRLRQRMGRVTRISSGFQRVEAEDVFIPVLDTPTDQRLLATIRKRIQLGDQLIPTELESDYLDLSDEVIEALSVNEDPSRQ